MPRGVEGDSCRAEGDCLAEWERFDCNVRAESRAEQGAGWWGGDVPIAAAYGVVCMCMGDDRERHSTPGIHMETAGFAAQTPRVGGDQRHVHGIRQVGFQAQVD